MYLQCFIPFCSGSIFVECSIQIRAMAMEKNILNIGTFIIALQSFDWMKIQKNAIEFYSF